MNKLQNTFNTLTASVKEKLKEYNINVDVGDKIWNKSYGICAVTKIDDEGIHFDSYDYYDDELYKGCFMFSEMIHDYNKITKLEKSWEEYEQEAKEYANDTEAYIQKQNDLISTSDTSSDSTDLIIAGGKNDLLVMQGMFQRITDKMKILEFILEKQKDKFVRMRNEFLEKLKHINRIILTLEIYMGIDEDIVQFKEGNNASNDEPLCLRQRLLYMDEEVADTRAGGWDFKNIQDFEKWLIDKDRYKIICPEEKCIVAMRPRRNKKEYNSGNYLLDAMLNENNFETFILIRNGENLYRICTDKFRIYKRLFPQGDEIATLEKNKDNDKIDYWKRKDEKEIEAIKDSYKFNILMMQGLIDRTQLFQPMKQGVNLFNMDTYGDAVKLIFDDEMLIHTGRPSFTEYMEEINKDLKRGSRVYIHLEGRSNEYTDRYRLFERTGWRERSSYLSVSLPCNGVYTIEEDCLVNEYFKEERTHGGKDRCLVIKYNPGDTIYNAWDRFADEHVRKNRISFYLNVKHDRIFNYDKLDLDDIEYYLNDRVERHNYLYMFDVLKDLKELRLQEIKNEKEFVRLIADRNDVEQKLVWKEVEWWKQKNIWKRPITQDNAKALRMIESRIKKLK